MQYFRPQTLPEALDILAGGAPRIAAGCTDLFPATAAPALQEPVLDVTAIEGLRGIAETPEYWRIGAATSWTDLICTDLPRAFDGLKDAAREVGSVQIQNSGTIAGNLCNASPAADGVPCLLTLDASVELASRAGCRNLPLSAFLTGVRKTALMPGELMSAILVPKTAGRGRSAFLKLGARRYLVISIAMVAARITECDGMIDDAAIAVGSCSPVAVRLPGVEAALAGQRTGHLSRLDLETLVTDNMVAGHLAPISDVRADADYRLGAAAELVRRAVLELVSQPGKQAA